MTSLYVLSSGRIVIPSADRRRLPTDNPNVRVECGESKAYATLQIDDDGRATIPMAVRDRLDLDGGEIVDLAFIE